MPRAGPTACRHPADSPAGGEFLSFIDRPRRGDRLLQPSSDATSIRSRVNGVMAGAARSTCRSGGAVEAIADPGSTSSMPARRRAGSRWSSSADPITEELGFYSGTGALRVGTRANTSIGRFMRLCFRNLAGWIPGQTDKGTIGSGFNVALSENDEATAGSAGRPPGRSWVRRRRQHRHRPERPRDQHPRLQRRHDRRGPDRADPAPRRNDDRTVGVHRPLVRPLPHPDRDEPGGRRRVRPPWLEQGRHPPPHIHRDEDQGGVGGALPDPRGRAGK